MIMVFMKSESLFVESSMSWMDAYNPETKALRYFPYNGNPTRALKTTSLKCHLPTTNAFNIQEKNSRMCMKVQGRLMQARFQAALLILFRNHCCYAATCIHYKRPLKI